MIRVTPSDSGLIDRLRLRAERVLARHLRSSGRAKRGGTQEWHSPAALWPDFTDDSTRI